MTARSARTDFEPSDRDARPISVGLWHGRIWRPESEDRVMPADKRSHVESRPLVRSKAGRALAGAILTASLSMGAALWASTENAAAMSFRGGGVGGFPAGRFRRA